MLIESLIAANLNLILTFGSEVYTNGIQDISRMSKECQNFLNLKIYRRLHFIKSRTIRTILCVVHVGVKCQPGYFEVIIPQQGTCCHSI